MHAANIVARILEPCLAGLHAKRAQALQRAVVALLTGGVLSLSALALAIRSPTHYKHRLKSVDRLLGNAAIQSARHLLYAALASRWLTGVERILLVVDWSDLTPDQRWQWLRQRGGRWTQHDLVRRGASATALRPSEGASPVPGSCGAVAPVRMYADRDDRCRLSRQLVQAGGRTRLVLHRARSRARSGASWREQVGSPQGAARTSQGSPARLGATYTCAATRSRCAWCSAGGRRAGDIV